MKKILYILALLLSQISFAQHKYITGDSTYIQSINGASGNNELIIMNSTRGLTGAVFTNMGNGRGAWVVGGGASFSFGKNSGGDSIVAIYSGVRTAVKDNGSSYTFAKNAGKDSTVFIMNGVRIVVKDSFGISQATLNDSVTALRSIRKQDTSILSKNGGGDSTVFTFKINGTQYRTAVIDRQNTGTVTSVSGTSPINVATGTSTPVISIDNAAADGGTKGAASFTANDFNSSAGNISLDYTNAQASSASLKGFLTAADWTTFNNKTSGRKVDTLYLNAGLDSLVYTIEGTRYAIKRFVGTVTSVSVTTANGVSGSVATSTTTPAITLTLGAIAPTSVNSVVISGSSTPTLAVTGTTTVSGTNTGDQTLSVSNNTITISGTNGNSQSLPRKVDTLFFNAGNDSLIYKINGTRYALAKTAFAFAKNAGGDSAILTINGTRYAVQDVMVLTFAKNTARDSNIITLNNAVRLACKDSAGGASFVGDHITILGTDWSSTTAGTWSRASDGNQMFSVMASNTGSQTQNDQINYLFGCTGGTYSINLCYILNTTFGIATILVDGVSVGTVDCYGGLTYNQFTTTTSIAIASGQHTISIKMATKNASASAYGARITYITLWRTGA